MFRYLTQVNVRCQFFSLVPQEICTMSALLITLLVIGGITLFLIILFINTYNRLVTLRNRFQNGFSQIEVQLKRRYDLIPNLIETAKG